MLIVLGLAGNKGDKFLDEQVTELEAEEYAKEIDAYYLRVSAFDGTNIKELFEGIGKIYLEPKNDIIL